jgi:hypothetical protein
MMVQEKNLKDFEDEMVLENELFVENDVMVKMLDEVKCEHGLNEDKLLCLEEFQN